MEKSKCPELKFKGFNESWNQQTLGDMFLPLSNNTLSRADLNYHNGQIKNIHYGDILIKYAAVLDYRNDKIPFITDGEVSDFKSQLLQNGDVIFADTAEDESVGKAIEINVSADTFIVSGLHTMAYRPKIKLSSFYLGHYLNSNAYHHQLLPLMQGVKVLSISRTNLAKTIVRYPLSEQEQTQIGNFFQNLDQSITLHEKKLTQTQNLKKAMLEKMFPKAGSTQPEIRLKGFSGDWALQPLENIFGKIRNAFVGTATPYYVKSGRFYLESNNVKDGKINRKSEIFINDYFYYKQQDKWLKTNDIVMVQSGHVGHTAVITEELNNSAAHALIMFTDYKVDADPHFINYQIQTDNAKNEIDKITTGNTIKHILSSDMKKFSLLFPCVKEQEKIGHFFKQLDETLVLQQQQLQTLKNLKQAFLEKMFV